MMAKRSLWMAIVSLALLGWVAACTGNSAMMDKPMDTGMQAGMGDKMNNMLMGSDGHHASGMVAFGMDMNKHVLTLSDIKVDKVPDGYVYLTKDADRMHGVELGMLKQFSGTVTYAIPAGVNPDDYDSVVIWCKQFNVEIGRAYFSKKMM